MVSPLKSIQSVEIPE